MTTVDAGIVAALADLARLSLDDDEREAFTRQLAAIVAHIDRLQAVDVEGLPPYRARVPEVAPLRDDLATAPAAREDLLAGAPLVADGLVVVPRFVEP